MSLTILSKDTLRTQVESASNGKVTVLYDTRGYPSYMCVIPKFNLSAIDATWPATPHPAFIVNGVTKDYIYIGQFQASLVDDLAQSIPNVVPKSTSNTVADMRDWCFDKGTGWHTMTAWEWAAVTLYAKKIDGVQADGNSNGAASQYNANYVGTLSSAGIIYTGSGPFEFRHTPYYYGIDGLIGNNSHFVDGIKYYDDSEFYAQVDNYYAQNLLDTAYGSEPASWLKLVHATGDMRITNAGYQTYALTTWSGTIANPGVDTKLLSYLLLRPLALTFETGILGQITNGVAASERYALRGGSSTSTTKSGIANCGWALTRTNGICNFRVAYIP